MPNIILSTLNARYIHPSLGLRYLKANMEELQEHTHLREYNINLRPMDIVENILTKNPDIIGFGVYIWNIEQTTQVVRLLKHIRPNIRIIIGGPEVSYEYKNQEITAHADYLITGAADHSFRDTCRSILRQRPPISRAIHAPPVPLAEIKLPYHQYTDEDIANRIIYVEASRGCPFKCEFCLSSLDRKVSPFDIDEFLEAMQQLYERGARHFKFVDRTFNLKADTSIRIMNFFLDKLYPQKLDQDKSDNDLFLHFELIPDNLPDRLKEIIARFPPHSLQFEIGIQSLNPAVQQLISRRQDADKTHSNLTWLRQQSTAHIHADLIIGLPGENIESFARGFNELYAMQPHEIQVGILKRLRGTPLIRHTDEYELCFNPYPPYTILSNNLIDFDRMQELNRFARYWDLIANSGRFRNSLPLLLADTPFEKFMQLTNWLYAETAQTHKLALDRLFKLLYRAMTDVFLLNKEEVEKTLLQDFQNSGLKGYPRFTGNSNLSEKVHSVSSANRRQKQHIH